MAELRRLEVPGKGLPKFQYQRSGSSGLRRCSVCHNSQPQTEFHFKNKVRGWRKSACKRCSVKERRLKYLKNLDRTRVTNDWWRRNNPEWLKTWHASYDKRKRYAQRKVQRAVKSGVLTRPSTCPSCGARGVRIEAHHDDYSKPLNVRWLCSFCHKQEHK